MMIRGMQIDRKAIDREIDRRTAPADFSAYLNYIMPDYDQQWFHTIIARKCQALAEGKLGKNRLMLFLPPQHGKSEIVSRKFPSWLLGKRPQLKIVSTSYSADLAKQFSRAVQRTLESPEYAMVFGGSALPPSGIEGRGMSRTADMFDTTGGGFYKAVGIGGSLTGTPADIGIIDDPIKDAMEASSSTYRDRIWNWYTDVFLTRLHNNSKQIVIQTRWHEDDLAGRLIAREGEKWEIISIPAIREDYSDPQDPRQIGEALWEDKHSLASLREVEARSPRTFAALYQQRPTVQGGNIVRRDWFGHVTEREFGNIHTDEPVVFFMDTAYTDRQENDPTGIIATCRIGGTLYVTHGRKVLMKFPDLIRFLPAYVRQHGYTARSSVRIEPRANGISVIDQLKEVTQLNITRTTTPTDSKETRLNAASPAIECGRVVLVDGEWTEDFMDEVCGFPAKPHDEYVDVLVYAIDYHLNNPYKPVDKKRLYRAIY